MFEHRTKPLLPRRQFYSRLMRSFRFGAVIILVSLGIGMAGYHFLEHEPWLDAFTCSAMILSGMGPVEPLTTAAGKLFAGCFALFSGVAFLTSIGIFFAPIAHRLIHKFHLEQSAEPDEKTAGGKVKVEKTAGGKVGK